MTNQKSYVSNKKVLLVSQKHKFKFLFYKYGGEGGIRTHGTVAGTLVFKTRALNHSTTSPKVRLNCPRKLLYINPVPVAELSNYKLAWYWLNILLSLITYYQFANNRWLLTQKWGTCGEQLFLFFANLSIKCPQKTFFD